MMFIPISHIFSHVPSPIRCPLPNPISLKVPPPPEAPPFLPPHRYVLESLPLRDFTQNDHKCTGPSIPPRARGSGPLSPVTSLPAANCETNLPL